MNVRHNGDVPENHPWWLRHPTLAYSAARLILFLVPFLLLLLVLDPLPALVIAFVASALASIFVLSRMRDAMSVSLSTRAERANQKMAERAASEDAWDEAQRTSEDTSDS